MLNINILYRYRIWDEDIGGYVNDESFYGFTDMLLTLKRDIDSYEDDTPPGEEVDGLTKHDEKFWSPKSIYSSLCDFNFQGGLKEWHCWFPGHHRKLIVNLEFCK